MSEVRRTIQGGPRPRSRARGGWLLVLGLSLGVSGCWVPGPKAEALLEYGFGSPGQAFRSFATAVQGELLDAVYDSLSEDFKRNRTGMPLSRVGFGEAWDELTRQYPYLRWGLYQATKDPEKLDYRSHMTAKP